MCVLIPINTFMSIYLYTLLHIYRYREGEKRMMKQNNCGKMIILGESR